MKESVVTRIKSLSLWVSLGSLALGGCTTLPVENTTEMKPQPEKEPIVVKEIPDRPFPPETLYALLVAEMAGSRSQFDIALANYVQQAHQTRDPGVTARATRIARFLNAHQAALDTALLWIQLEPDNGEAHLIAATELAKSGRLLEALDQAETLLDGESSTIFQNIAARAASATDTQREQLLFRYDQLLTSHPTDDGLLLGKALLEQQKGHFDTALSIANELLELHPGHITGTVLKAKLLEDMDKPSEALALLSQELQNAPEDSRLRLQYARLLANYDLNEAYEQFQILHEQQPHDPDIVFSLALINHEQGRFDEAKQYFEQLIQMGARTSSAHFYLARIAERQKDYATALEQYLQVQPGPDFLPAVSQITDLLISAGELQSVNDHLSAIRQRFPQEAARLYLLEAEKLGKYQYLEEAEQKLTEGLTFDPENNQLLYARAMINDRRDFIDLLEMDLRSILRYDPNHADALNALGYALADRTTRYQEALELISQALKLKPDDPAIIDSMGWVQYRLGNYEEAILRLREALKQLADPVIASHLGEVLWVSGQQDEAKAVFDKAIKQAPQNQVLHEAIERLGADIALPLPNTPAH